MIDKAGIINQVKRTLTAKEARQESKIQGAFLFAVSHLSSMLTEKERLTKENVAVAADTREVTLKGVNCDVAQIYYILYGEGDEQSWLEFVDDYRFLKNYNNSAATAGTPGKFTFIGLSGGFPRVRFDVPAEEATTMDVWYYSDFDQNLIRDSKGPALYNLTVSYFHGPGSEKGAPYYTVAKDAVKAYRAVSKPVQDHESRFYPSDRDRTIAGIRQTLRERR